MEGKNENEVQGTGEGGDMLPEVKESSEDMTLSTSKDLEATEGKSEQSEINPQRLDSTEAIFKGFDEAMKNDKSLIEIDKLLTEWSEIDKLLAEVSTELQELRTIVHDDLEHELETEVASESVN